MRLSRKQINDFQQLVLDHYHEHGRHNLPWRTTYTTPYHILIAEIMLQQTQVDRVIPKFLDFVTTFPTIQDLTEAPQAAVLTHWVGLGYNRRARMLHQAAGQIMANYAGKIPSKPEELITLPGIGPYTSASIPTFAYNLPTLVLDTNIRAIYIHHFFSNKTEKISDNEILSLVKVTLKKENPREWYSALMDYGTYLKSIGVNPIARSHAYSKQTKFVGSTRQLRGAILRELTTESPQSTRSLTKKLMKEYTADQQKIEAILAQLSRESLLFIRRDKLTLS